MHQGQSPVLSGWEIKLHFCGWCATVFFAVQVSSVACCAKMMTGHFQNCPPTALSQQGFGCNRYALELSKLYFYFWWTECVLAALTTMPEWVKGYRFYISVFRWLELENHHRKCSRFLSLLPPAMSSSSSCICRWKIFSWRSHRVCFIFSLRVTM